MEHFRYENGELRCEDVPVSRLAEEFGTPLWIYSKASLLDRYRELATAFQEAKPVLCYSVKSNSLLAVLRVMQDAGSGFDVVSGGELYRVQQAGGEMSRVVFAGVGKTDEELRAALEADILMFNVESEAELDALARVAASLDVVAPVALRLNPNIDAHTHAKTTTGKRGNKFGMDIERVLALADKVSREDRLALRGIHMHLGSPILTTQPYEAAAEQAALIVRDLRDKGHKVDWINLGGGFGINYKRDEALPAAEYAKVIVPRVLSVGCRLALEPGRFISGNSGVLVSRVIFTKHEGGKRFIIQDAAMNDLVRPAMYDAFHRIWPVRPAVPVPDNFESAVSGCEPADVVGPICESGDYLAKDRSLPNMDRGDLLCTFSAGAYGTAMSSNYNSRPRGAEVLVDGSEYQLIRRRETYEDLVRHEK